MEYEEDFVGCFIKRTQAIVQEYMGELDATLLINCLLGLLVVPNEKLFAKIPEMPFERLNEWGIYPESIKSVKCNYGNEHLLNLRQLVRQMRNSVAHFDVSPKHKDRKVTGFSFKDHHGIIYADLTLDEIKNFVIKLASCLEQILTIA